MSIYLQVRGSFHWLDHRSDVGFVTVDILYQINPAFFLACMEVKYRDVLVLSHILAQCRAFKLGITSHIKPIHGLSSC